MGLCWNNSFRTVTDGSGYHLCHLLPTIGLITTSNNSQTSITCQSKLNCHQSKHMLDLVLTQENIRDLGWDLLQYPMYSPDIASPDNYLFRSPQSYITARNYSLIDYIKISLTKFFVSILYSFYEKGINDLLQRWRLSSIKMATMRYIKILYC